MSLGETFVGFAAAMLANDGAEIADPDAPTNQRVHRLFTATKTESVFNLLARLAGHF